MEAEEKKEKFLSALLTEPNIKDISQLAQKLVNRKRLFEDISVETTALVFLTGTQFSRVHKDITPALLPPISDICGQLIKHALSLFDHESSCYLPPIKLIQNLCESDGGLSDPDVQLLMEIVKDQDTLDAKFTKECDDVVTGDVSVLEKDEKQEVHVDDRRDSKADAAAEIQKLYSQMRAGRKKSGSMTSIGSPAGVLKLEKPPAIPEVEEFFQTNIDLLKEQGGLEKLLLFCVNLPVFAEIASRKKEFFSDENTLTNKLFQVKCAIEASLIVTSLCSNITPLTSSSLTSLTSLVLKCITAVTTAIINLNPSVLSKKSEQKTESDTSSVKTSPTSVVELLGSLSVCKLPSPSSIKGLIQEIITGTLKVIKKVENIIKGSEMAKATDTYITIVAYNIFSGLLPVLTPILKPSGIEQSGVITAGQIRLNVPIGQLIYLALQMTISLLEPLSGEMENEKIDDDLVNALDLNINGSYSRWQLSCVLLKQFPLFDTILSVMLTAFKKVLTLTETPSREGSQTEIQSEPSFADIKPEQSDRDKQLFRRLQDSLSSKISEVMVTKEKENEEKKDESDEEKTLSFSPSSTISSSGEAHGEYIVNPDNVRSQDDDETVSGEEEGVYEQIESLLGPLLLPHQVEVTPVPLPPPPPPLPPKRTRFFKPETLTPLFPTATPHLPQNQPEKDSTIESKKKPVFYLGLSLIAARCLLEGMVQSSFERLQKFLISQMKVEHVSTLSWLFSNIHTISTGSNKSGELVKLVHFTDLLSTITDLVHEMILSGIITHEHHWELLRDLGLHHGCWPLHVMPATLSLLARVLICRLKTLGGDDQLTYNIWKGFLSTLEDNAANENEADEDLSVSHLQLLLLVWHNFSDDTRKNLLLKCVSSVNRVAEERESNVLVPPLAVCRLLLVLQYMLFQFSEPCPKLAEQVTGNLLTDTDTVSLPLSLSPQPVLSHTVDGVLCYPCEQQLQYQRVLSKPGVSTKEARKEGHSSGVHPQFYNVRPSMKPDSTSSEGTESKVGIDPDACQIVLKCPGMESNGYEKFYQSLIILMSCGSEYRLYSEDLLSRLISVCAGHQCMDLCLSMLTNLPPSFSALTAIVDGTGLSLKGLNGSCLLVLMLLFSVKLRMQQIDTEDIVDTLTESGHSSEVSEELVARVISVVDSTEHFINQAITVMEDFCTADEDTMMPLISITTINMLLCLIQRTLQEALEEDEDEEKEEEEEEEEAMDIEKEKEEDGEAGEKEQNKEAAAEDEVEEEEEGPGQEFYDRYADKLVPVLLKVASKLVSYGHLYVCRDVQTEQGLAEDMEKVIKKLLSISGIKLITSKTKCKPSFMSHIPNSMHERLKTWNSSILLDQVLLDKLCSYSADKINLFDELWVLLDISFNSFANYRTFEPTRSLKTSISTVMVLLASVLELRSQKSTETFLDGVVPLSIDLITEFCVEGMGNDGIMEAPLKEICSLFDGDVFSRACIKHRVIECFKLVQCPELGGHTFQGVILEDLFILLNNLLDSPSDWSILAGFDEYNPPTNIVDLIQFCSLSSLSSSAVSEGMKLLVKILKQSDENPQDHLTILCAQISMLALLPIEKLQSWLRRLVIGSVNDSTSDVVGHVKLLHKFVDLLTKEDCSIPSLICQSMLTALLPLGPKLVEMLPNEHKLLVVFKEYFNSCVMLAGRQSERGHLQLVEAATQWLPNCVNLTKSNWNTESDLIIPVTCIMGYLAHLTSAVQLITDRTKCNERRNLANEDDYSVLENVDDEESIIDEEEEYPITDDESLNEKLCTFLETKREFRNQHWYHCHTCKLIDGTGCCNVCVKVCHKGHDVTYSKFGSFFCDCGAKEDGSCKAMVKRTSSSRPSSPTSGEGAAFSENRKRRKKRKGRFKKSAEQTDKKSGTSKSCHDERSTRNSMFPTSFINRLTKQIESYKDELKDFLSTANLVECSMDLLRDALPKVIAARDTLIFRDSSVGQEALSDLHTKKKNIEHADNILSSPVGCQDGVLENIKLNVTGDQGQLIKQLLGNNATRRAALCAMMSPRGQQQHLVCSHDKGKLTIFQLSSLLKQPDAARRKLTRLGTASVPFTILSLASNLCNEEYLAVSGVKECQVLTISSSGQMTDRLSLQPSVESNGYIVKTFWVPGSQTELAVVADTFVKIYDLSSDVLSPTYYFIVCSDKIRDACFIITEESKFLVVMMSTGQIYFQPIIPECNASEGPVYFTIDFVVEHANIKEADSQVCEGGVSIHYSHSLKLLFFSYQNGKSFVASLDDSLCKTREVFEIILKNNTVTNNGKTTTLPLTHWSETYQHPGLICALTTGTNNPVVLTIKPESIQIYEVKALPAKSKVNGMVVVRHPSGNQGNPPRTTVLLACEDGNLRIHLVANISDTVLYWLQPRFQPVTPLAYLSLQCQKKSIVIRKRSMPPKIPVDFFEHCQRMQNSEVDFLGNDILHVYNKEQVKHRFNVGGLYIANTKLGGFSIDVYNIQSDTTVMVGIRVILGGRSLERAPSTIEIFGRTKQVTFPNGSARCFDIPFSREESLQADKSFKLSFGPSLDPSGINMVDCIRVYSKTKEEFGWPESPATGLSLTRRQVGDGGGEEDGETGEVLHTSGNRNLGPIDKLLCNAFSVLGNYCLSSPLSVGIAELVTQATPLLNLNLPYGLQYHTRFLLSSAVKDTVDFHLCKDHLQLSNVKQTLITSMKEDNLSAEQYQHLLIVFLVTARSHPEHLSLLPTSLKDTLNRCLNVENEQQEEVDNDKETDGSDMWMDIIKQLNDIFWSFYNKRPHTPVTAPVCSTGLIAVETTVCVIVELMWSVVSQYPDILCFCIPHLIKLLTAADSQISCACVKTLVKLLKPKSPKSSPEPENPKEEKEQENQKEEQNVTQETQDGSEEITEQAEPLPPPPPPVEQQQQQQQQQQEEQQQEQQQQEEEQQQEEQQQPLDLESVLANPAAAMDQLIANPGILGLIPDEEAMMNFAIAMSLHEEGSPGSVQAMQNALQGLGLAVPPAVPPEVSIVHLSDQPEEGDERVPTDEEEEELEEEQMEGSIGDGVEQLEGVVIDRESLIDSLNSSYEDLVVPEGEGVVVRVGRRERVSLLDAEPKLNGDQRKNDSERDEAEKKGKVGQDITSEPDIPIDSSAEEDNEDSSFLEIYEQFDKPSEISMATDKEGVNGGTDEDKAERETDGVMSKEHTLQLKLLTSLAEHISDVETVGGTRAIPYLQILLFLSGCLEGSHKDGEAFSFLLTSLLDRLNMSLCEVTTMMNRSNQSEVLLLLLRFFNIIMSRKRMKGDRSESVSANRLWYCTANTLLQSHCMSFCLRMLKGLLDSKVNFKSDESSSAKSESNLLKPHSRSTLVDMSPFFQQQYVKNHTSDVFETYSYLLADIALALPCQLKRFCEKTNVQPPLEFDSEWMETLCQYFMASSQASSSGKKQIRKVLVYVCGSKEKYRLVRDKYALCSYISKVSDMCSAVRFDPSNLTATLIHLPYNSLLKLIEQLRLCDEIAKNRTINWQAFCLEETSTLPHLFLISLSLDEGLAPTILRLLHSALSGVHSSEGKEGKKRDGEKSKSKEREKEKEVEKKGDKGDKKAKEELSTSLTQLLLESLNDELLVKFLKRFLLQSNHSNVRWQCHALVHSLYKHSPPTQKVHLVQLLWQLWPDISGCGHKASQFVDLLGYSTISTPEVLSKDTMCVHLVHEAIELLRCQNSMVLSHANCHVYSQLASLVDFDGYYLESEPCLVCNDPEVPFNTIKLYSMKSEVRYSPNTIFLKLNGSHMFSQLHVRINEIRKTKMIRTMNLYYSNRTVQNVIELKNNRSLWLKAGGYTLQPSQTEVKVDFPLPIVARNVILEFADFYENVQGGSEMLQCPRCNAAVPAHPGVCAACGENVHQCHKCRAINYDERDPFLCNSCGFSKYARFDIVVEGRSCSAVDPIENEDDRQKTLSNINQLLEKADNVYKDLVQHRNELDHLLVALASGAVVTSRSGSSSEGGVNRAIQAVAQLYCQSCKNSYQELSKIIQSVLASRKELVTYDMKKLQTGKITTPSSEPTTPITPLSEGEGVSLSFPLSAAPLSEGNCFGCASSTLEHCITVLKALAFKPETRKILVQENLVEELVEFNLRSGSAELQKDVQRLLCQLTRDNPAATQDLNEFITQRVMQQIKPQRISPNLTSAVQPEIQLLTASIAMEDSCWEERLKAVMQLFRKSRSHKSPVVMAAVTMPCLKILHSLINPRVSTSKSDIEKLTDSTEVLANIRKWLKNEPDTGFEKWKESAIREEPIDSDALKEKKLARKYFQIWMDKTLKSKGSSPLTLAILKQASWLKVMLFNASSRAARRMACNILYSLCNGETRQRQILDLLSCFLDQVGSAGEASQEFLELFQKLMQDNTGRWKLYLARRNILLQIGTLISKEIDYLLKLEETTLNSDLSQGYALQMLTALLKSFLAVESIKCQYKSQLVGRVLNGYLSLKRLVTQRTKRIDECQKLLLQMLETLTSGTEEERKEFMAVCVQTLTRFPMGDMVTPIFVFEQLCNIIHPEEEDVGEFFLSLEKDPQQEEFLQGRMQGNPYSSREAGLGPLMRDVKNKICTDCELVALLEDDTGMELLVCNKIISLDLPVKEVYKKIWCAQPNHGQRMKVVYRMRGLLGDATEDMVEKLDEGKGNDVDEEEVYMMSAVLEKCHGLDAILTRLSHARDFIRSHGLISAALKLLGYCAKVKINRQYLVQPQLNTLNILLGILNMALHYEQQESNGIGAAVAQQVLSVTEPILLESSSQQRVIVRTISEEMNVKPLEQEEDSRLPMLLRHIESPFVQSNLGVREGLMHIIPFLTFGDPKNMTVLLKHFAPYLDFEKFDSEKTPENSLYLDCFCVVANGIGKDESSEKLKDLAIEMKLTPSAVEYIGNKTPSKGSGRFDSTEWSECVSLPSLPHVLKMLTGLSQHHSKTQLMVCEVVSQLHLLEQVSSTEHHIGTLAEKLLETMRTNPTCDEKICEVREATRTEKKKRAMEMRAKELGALGFQVNAKGQLIAKTPTAFKDIESEVIEETGIRCCICIEGYRNQPQKILGIYTFTKKVTLDEFENKPRKTVGYSTVSHFNVVHYECHSAAIKLARGRDEWESATLQNANTRCNGILPIWGPQVSDSAFASSLARHNGYLQECTGLYDPSFRSYAHDLRLLLLRFSHETSFSAETGGGGPQSNMHLIPYIIHVALYVIDTTRVYQREEKNLNNFVIATPDKWISSSYELEGPLHSITVSLLIYTLPQWEEHKLMFLRQLIVLAHARNTSSSPIKNLPSPEPAQYAVYRPVLIMFALVDGMHRILKKSLSATGAELLTTMLEYIRNSDVAIGEGCDKLLAKYQEEILPAESFEEFCDVNDLLSVIENPNTFLKELIASVASQS